MSGCNVFRVELEARLRRAGSGESFTELGWHEHLLACDACRRLLEEEEALEALLATLPEPHLPSELSQRVLLRLEALRGASDEALDRLLARERDPEVPEGLASRVLDGLGELRETGAERDVHTGGALDRLLGRVPAPAVPRDLAARVLEGLEHERADLVPAPRRRAPWVRTSAWIAAAAAAAVVALALWRSQTSEPALQDAFLPETTVADVEQPTLERTPERTSDDPSSREQHPGEPSAALLAQLEVLEDWELLMVEDDLDLTLAELDEVDELLLALEDS